MSAALTRLAELIQQASGIWIKPDQLAPLEAAVKRVDPRLSNDERRLADVTADSPALRQLIEEITVKETFFFRQVDVLRAVDWQAMVARARRRGAQRARVWVAACATGEEAYTLAILASEAFAPAPVPVEILGTDVSRTALERARAGVYGRRSVRVIDKVTAARYFTRRDEDAVVGPELRELVTFTEHNLALDHSPCGDADGFDLITCRNVLIYFDPPTIERVIASLERSLARGGELHLGAADRLCVSAQSLARVHAERDSERPAFANNVRRTRRRTQRPADRAIRAGAKALATEGTDALLQEAMRAADREDLELAAELASRLLGENRLDADAYFVRGLAEFGLGDLNGAVASFRAALYVDGDFGLAAFQLARAHDERGERDAAARAYRRALTLLSSAVDSTNSRSGGAGVTPREDRHAMLYSDVDPADIAAACSIRLTALSPLEPANAADQLRTA